MAYELKIDQNELFEAKIDVKGAKLSDSFCRLVLLSEDWNLMFEGEIDKNGYVEIPIKKLKNLLSEGEQGNLKLEVVVDDTYFVPWSDTFEVVIGKTVTAEVKSSKKGVIKEEKTTVQASVIRGTKSSPSKKPNKSKTDNNTVLEALQTVISRRYPTLNESAKSKLVNSIKSYIDGKQSRK